MEQITMLYEFGAACFLPGCPVGKTTTEKDSHMYHDQSNFFLPFCGCDPSEVSLAQGYVVTKPFL